MGYLQDFVYYSSGTEVPPEFVWWSGLSLLGHILGHKVWVQHGDYFRFRPNIYVCPVGTAGSGKNTALTIPQRIMIEHFPELMMSASIQSREDIADLMALDDTAVTWQDKNGELGIPGKAHHYRPFYILNMELASFLSVDKKKMCEFLIEVFDGEIFSTGFKGDRRENPGRKQWFTNPHVSMIAAAVPDWFMGTLKMDLFDTGLGRRLIIVHATRTKIEPEPRKPQGADAALSRAIEYLKKARFMSGGMTLNDQAQRWWNEWYRRTRNKPPEDRILAQFHETRHMQLLKVSMLLEKAENLDSKKIKSETLEAGLMLIESLYEPILKLTSGVGKNELAGVSAEIEIAVQAAGTRGISKKKILAMFYRQTPGGLRNLEFDVLPYLQKTGKVVALAPRDHPEDAILWTPENHKAYEKTKPSSPPPSTEGSQQT